MTNDPSNDTTPNQNRQIGLPIAIGVLLVGVVWAVLWQVQEVIGATWLVFAIAALLVIPAAVFIYVAARNVEQAPRH